MKQKIRNVIEESLKEDPSKTRQAALSAIYSEMNDYCEMTKNLFIHHDTVDIATLSDEANLTLKNLIEFIDDLTTFRIITENENAFLLEILQSRIKFLRQLLKNYTED